MKKLEDTIFILPVIDIEKIDMTMLFIIKLTEGRL